MPEKDSRRDPPTCELLLLLALCSVVGRDGFGGIQVPQLMLAVQAIVL